LGKFFHYIPYFSYARYFIEIIYLYELKKLRDITNVNVSLEIFSYEWGDKYYIWPLAVVYGFIFRLIAIIILTINAPQSFSRKIINRVMNKVLSIYNMIKNKFTDKVDSCKAISANYSEESTESFDFQKYSTE
jgi:hypothetical protein